MPPVQRRRLYTALAAAVNTITVGWLAVCAAAVVSVGTAIPACIVAGLASLLSIGLSLNNDMQAGTVAVSAGNPDPAPRDVRNARDVVKWYREHDNGFLEDYTGRIHELRQANESTFTVVDAISGYRHYVEKKSNSPGYKIRTNLGNALKSRRQAESPGGWLRHFPSLKARSPALAARSSYSLSSAVMDTQQLISDASYASSASAYSAAASDILQVAASGLGTYCVTISSSAGQPADIGLTLEGGGIEASDDEPPCKASKRIKKRGT